jgi:hypothetical protein
MLRRSIFVMPPLARLRLIWTISWSCAAVVARIGVGSFLAKARVCAACA